MHVDLSMLVTAALGGLPSGVILEPREPGAEQDWAAWHATPCSFLALREEGFGRTTSDRRDGARGCSARAFFETALCSVIAACHRALRPGMTRFWGALVADVVARLEGTPASAPGPIWAPGEIAGVRRAALASTYLHPALSFARSAGAPFALLPTDPRDPRRGFHLLRLRRLPRGGRRGPYTAVSTEHHADHWLEDAAFRLAREIAPAEGARSDHTAVQARLAADGKVRGTGALAPFGVERRGSLTAVTCDVGGPFLQQTGLGGAYILWEAPLRVVVALPPEEVVGSARHLTVYAEVVATPPEPFGGRCSDLRAHPHVHSEDRRICMADTSELYARMAGGGADPVSELLECRLRAAARVLRWGWRQTNGRTPYHAPAANERALVLLDARQAAGYVAQHANAELVPWER